MTEFTLIPTQLYGVEYLGANGKVVGYDLQRAATKKKASSLAGIDAPKGTTGWTLWLLGDVEHVQTINLETNATTRNLLDRLTNDVAAYGMGPENPEPNGKTELHAVKT